MPAPPTEVYKFTIWATDGGKLDPADSDTFRIRIWDEDEVSGSEMEIYDNGPNQAIGGGNIAVHKPSKKK